MKAEVVVTDDRGNVVMRNTYIGDVEVHCESKDIGSHLYAETISKIKDASKVCVVTLKEGGG